MPGSDYEETRAQLVDVACRVLEPERAATLEPQLAERALHLWLVDTFPLGSTDEPDWTHG